MKVRTSVACTAWLLFSLIFGFALAHPTTFELASASNVEDLAFSDVLTSSDYHRRALGVADIPACGIRCLIQHVPESGCSLTDTLCICTRAGLGQVLSACMLANCTVADNIGTARVNAEMCMLSDESQRRSVMVYTITVYAIALTLVALRVVGKVVSTGLAWNDAPIVAAVFLAAVPIACVLEMSRIGFGEHLWNLDDGIFLPILRYFYVAWSTYVAILGLIKLSLIMFYLDVFPTRSFKIAGWIIFWYIALNTLIIFLLTVFTCTPVSAFWNRDLKGKCMDIQLLGYANSISAIVQDIILIILPMSYLRNLQMKRSRKVAVAVMFMIGSFGCVTTIVRLRTLLVFKISYDPTWDYVPIVIWTELEITAAFACVSLPAIRVLLVKIAPKSWVGWLSDITHGSSHQTPRRTTGSSPLKRETWVNLESNGPVEGGLREKIGFLPSAETSTSHLRSVNSRTTLEQSDVKGPTVGSVDVPLVELVHNSPRRPVSVRSKFSG